jgi:HAD superfamily phosphatase (TIGR01668 family)
VLSQLRPSLYVSSVYAIRLDGLWERGIRGIIVDLDNTLLAWDSDGIAPELRKWVDRVRARGFRLCVVSNNGAGRVSRVADALSIPGIARAGKPRRRAFHQAMRVMGTAPDTTAVIGDQLFTDVLGGNRLRLLTILVVPIAGREYWSTRLVRRVERWFLPEGPLEHHG